MSWRGPWPWLGLLCLAVWCLTWTALDKGLAAYTGAALAQLPPRGVTPTVPTPRTTPRPSVPAPAPTTPAVVSPTPSTGVYTRWRIQIEYQDPTTGQWVLNGVHSPEGAGPIKVELTLQRYPR